ncbi:sugar ABC transporter permease [Martelella sp. HB161492]|uniref:carbohydrate ABC transporter permease n=1 Tax=Martelella sp. HB161492 TaxID=2720726 RepID=UPI001AED61E0|nr:sugar ABC transporter permease [Martelella sp. HB161492]
MSDAPAKSATNAGPPNRLGRMARREMRFAYGMLAPTFLIVLAVVLLPLIANFWISFKPVQLSDLRAPTLSVNERLRGKLDTAGDTAEIEYRLRNTSQKAVIAEAGFTDTLPEGLVVSDLDPRCTLSGQDLTCRLGDVPARFREDIKIKVTAGEAYIAKPVNPRDSEAASFGDADNVLTNMTFTLDNYRKVFSSSDFWHVLRVTFYYTVFGTLSALVLGLFAAQLLNQHFRGRSMLRGLFLFPYVAPVIAVAFTWIILLDPYSGTLNALLVQAGMIGTPIDFFGQRSVDISLFGFTFGFPVALTTVIAFEAWRYFPLAFLFILARMQALSSDVYEAAEIDGATPLQQFWYISLPQLIGILAVLFLLRFIWTFNKFDDIFLLTGGGAGTRTLTVDVYEQAFAISNLGAGAAVAVVVFAVLLAFSLLFFTFSPQDDG